MSGAKFSRAAVRGYRAIGMQPDLTRRGILGAGIAISLDGVAVRHGGSSLDNELTPDSTPDEVLSFLYAGNERFANGEPLARNRNIERVRQVAKEQKPFAAFLGCADSRVPIEILFDQGFGDIFVTRIAGNVASSENVGSLEFGTLVLGAKVLYVLGHTNCGAVAATIQAKEVPGQISGLFQYIRPAAKEAKGDIAKAVELNVRNQAIALAESSPVIAQLIREKRLVIAGGVYDLSTGKVVPIDLTDESH
jgi:carbonic anhydrase